MKNKGSEALVQSAKSGAEGIKMRLIQARKKKEGRNYKE